MSSQSERTRNNIRAGIFVTIVLLLAFATLFILTDATSWFDTRDHYTLRFTVADGVEGLGPGAEVRVGGMTRGKVTTVRPEPAQDTLETILVDFELDSEITLYPDAVATRVAPLLGSVAWINFIDVGSAAAGSPLPNGAVLKAQPGLGWLRALLGPDNATSAGRIVSNAVETTDFLATLSDKYNQQVVPLLGTARSTLNTVDETAAQFQTDYNQWSGDVGLIFDRVTSAADQFDNTISEGRQLIDEMRETVNTSHAILDENRGNIRSSTANFKALSEDASAISQQTRSETMEKVTKLLDRGRTGVDSFASAMNKAELVLDEQTPSVRQSIASARLAAQQLQLATVEIRRNPWKLLYRPSTEELEHELLYEAARTFALAASDLKAASQSVDRVLTKHSEQLEPGDTRLEEMSEQLENSFENYQQAQQRLFDVLLAERGQQQQ